MPTIQANGIRMYYERQGAGEPLVCISGLAATHDSWILVRQALAEHLSVITFDNRGIGNTDAPEEPYSVDQMADDTAALMDELGISSAYFLGHSMGSAIAMSLAARYPRKVKTLVLANAFIRLRPAAVFAFRTNALLLREKVPESLVFQVIMPWLFSDAFFKDPSKAKALLDANKSMPSQQSLSAFERQLDAATCFDAQPLLKNISSKTLVITSHQDILVLPEEGIDLEDKIPGAVVKSLPTGHLSMIERPDDFSRMIVDFICKSAGE
ncbi:MAG: alpha/beta hydrolase [Lentisphaerota bacterium]